MPILYLDSLEAAVAPTVLPSFVNSAPIKILQRAGNILLANFPRGGSLAAQTQAATAVARPVDNAQVMHLLQHNILTTFHLMYHLLLPHHHIPQWMMPLTSSNRHIASVCNHLGIQDAARKSTAPRPGVQGLGLGVQGMVSQEKWEKAQSLVLELYDMLSCEEGLSVKHTDGWLPTSRGFI